MCPFCSLSAVYPVSLTSVPWPVLHLMRTGNVAGKLWAGLFNYQLLVFPVYSVSQIQTK